MKTNIEMKFTGSLVHPISDLAARFEKLKWQYDTIEAGPASAENKARMKDVIKVMKYVIKVGIAETTDAINVLEYEQTRRKNADARGE